MSSKVLSITTLIGVLFLIFSCESTPEEVVENQNPHARSEIIYQEACAECHGMEIAAFADRKWEYGSEKDSIIQVIKVGISEEEMPGYSNQYSDGAIDSLADYILAMKEKVDYYQFEGEKAVQGIYSAGAYDLKLDTVVTGLNSPWDMAFLPSEEMLVTDKSGKLYRVPQSGEKIQIANVPEVLFEGQGGLFDILLHPDFENNQVVYLSYSIFKEDGDDVLASTAVTRAVLENDQLTNSEIIFEAMPYFTTRHHYGGRMVFDQDGKLWITVGDRGRRDENPQALDRYPGKVHRINDDGSIPDDNPFVGQDGAVASIFSYGHRNPQGMTVHPETGEIWTHEHGPRGGDEINTPQKGLNYGWPVISYGINYNGTTFTNMVAKEGMEQPLHYWVPSIGPSGMTFIAGNRYPEWSGNLLVGSLKYQFVSRLVLSGKEVVEEESLLQKIGRVRSLDQGLDGYIYVGVEGSPGFVARLMPQ